MSNFMGGLLVALGMLLATTTGLCTGAAILSSISVLVDDPLQALSASPLLLIGIVPCVLGLFMIRSGLRKLKSNTRL